MIPPRGILSKNTVRISKPFQEAKRLSISLRLILGKGYSPIQSMVRKSSCRASQVKEAKKVYPRFLSTALSTFPAARKKNEAIKSTAKTKKRIFAIPAAAEAMPPNPKTPAIRANMKNVSAQDNIAVLYLGNANNTHYLLS